MNKEAPRMRFLSRSEVVKRVGLSRFTLVRMEANGTFPRSFRIGRVRRAYIEADVIEWQECQISGRIWRTTNLVTS